MNRSILLVDDDMVTNFINSKIIINYGDCEKVEIKKSGKDALDYLYENNVPIIILLDINMPIMSGFDFLDEYYSYGFNKNETIIIMLTSSVFETDKIRAMNYDKVVSFFTKPLSKDKILEMNRYINSVE